MTAPTRLSPGKSAIGSDQSAVSTGDNRPMHSVSPGAVGDYGRLVDNQEVVLTISAEQYTNFVAY